MAQFDVFENPSVAQRAGFPYVVVLQSDHLSHYTTRFVMPLARLEQLPKATPRRLASAVPSPVKRCIWPRTCARPCRAACCARALQRCGLTHTCCSMLWMRW